MPQLDIVSFLSQSFWLWFFFIGFFFNVLMFILPKLARIVKFRLRSFKRFYIRGIFKIRKNSKACFKRSSACVLNSLDINKGISDTDVVRATENVEIQTLRKRLATKSARLFSFFHNNWGKKYHKRSLIEVELGLSYSLVIEPGFDQSQKPLMAVVLLPGGENK
jgi:hypothetical protein|uniref:ATP synthase F0 subunit 8 n=1 Tax=Scherffelia dubia TaxID=3190 RepID=A0A650ART4_SCHDU|nr:ATP synthase F0 subunit 8 [Scherffelia dubia]YP_009720880.1 ATP synthase F0 subunit 8 [Scherffelia dubia]QGP70667.1 ATP synthase F0 subunit 8 [Scherffelia dubia]QGP70680.1 ATP synthase F0 subunit 8 [Scherffelia dubia]